MLSKGNERLFTGGLIRLVNFQHVTVVLTFHLILDQFIAVKIMAHYTSPLFFILFHSMQYKSINHSMGKTSTKAEI